MAEEKQFEEKIKRYLKEQGCWYVKFFANSFTKQGVPDLLCCVNGHFVAVEVKASLGRPSDLQKWNIQKIGEAKGIGIILYPKDFERFKKLIQILKQSDKDYSKLWELNVILERSD